MHETEFIQVPKRGPETKMIAKRDIWIRGHEIIRQWMGVKWKTDRDLVLER